jgi:hypothetical protein
MPKRPDGLQTLTMARCSLLVIAASLAIGGSPPIRQRQFNSAPVQQCLPA